MEFEALLPTADDRAGPSWGRNDWPTVASDDLTRALDAAEMLVTPGKVAKKAVTAASAPGADPEAIARAAQDAISALMLIRTYRVRGHLAANLDPLGLSKRDLPADLTPEYHGFGAADLDRPVHLRGARAANRNHSRNCRHLAAQLLRQCRA